jgi:glutamyl-tRNA synthetase
MTVRVRFAPSPTGHLHIGGLRAALFNWLFARHNGGTFVLRIEDTDLERSKQEYTDSILASFAWLGIVSDEPVAIQSHSAAYHQKVLQQLLADGKAYKCYCTEEDLAARNCCNEEFRRYDRHCRNCLATKGFEGKPFVVRFKVPDDVTEVTFNDTIRGTITFVADQLDDFIIARSDGSSVYNYVVVLDDIAMGITHVIRGEEHIGNTPKQILLYRALGASTPEFAHLPLILSPTGGKLSKRDGATAVIDYKQMGYLPDALINCLVRLGWSHGDQEIFSRQELITHFTLEHVGKSGSIFDIKKLDWLNGHYIRQMTATQLLEYIEHEMNIPLSKNLERWNTQKILHAIDLYKERAVTINDIINELVLLYSGVTDYVATDEIKQWFSAEAKQTLQDVVALLSSLSAWDLSTVKEALHGVCTQKNLKMPHIAQPVRVALIGKTTSPGVAELLVLLGKDDSCNRITSLIRAL